MWLQDIFKITLKHALGHLLAILQSELGEQWNVPLLLRAFGSRILQSTGLENATLTSRGYE